MNLENVKSRALVSWATVGVLAVLCLVLASLQYVWIGEISRAERTRLLDGLQSSVQRLARDSNAELSALAAGLRPTNEEIESNGRERAYAARLARWRESASNPALLRRTALAFPEHGDLHLLIYDDVKESYQPSEWPREWAAMQDVIQHRLEEREGGERRGGPPVQMTGAVFEIPRFGPSREGPGPVREQEWLVVELDVDFIRATYLPALIARHIGTGMPLSVRVTDRAEPNTPIFESGPVPHADHEAEATVGLLEFNRFEFFGRGRGGFGPGGRKGAAPGGRKEGGPGPEFRNGGPPDPNRGRWRLDVRYAEGSLDSIVNRIRWRNLGISAAILALMMLTAVLLVRYSRQQQHLAEMQMNFVAGVSHELRTPLTVIRTAAFNLRGRVAANPAQVERYGALIQDESEKLTALVEQVLRFSRARAGHAVGERTPVAVESVVEESLHARRLGVEGARIIVEKHLEEGLPLVMADELALKHAIQNLLDNAVKYGTENSDWIGVSARKVSDANGDAVEVRIADRGPGIPADEQRDIFNPFFRGRRAQQDQIHGTGLGLNLVKKIVEAHQGTIRVESEPGAGTTFIMRIPAAPAELQDEFAHTAG